MTEEEAAFQKWQAAGSPDAETIDEEERVRRMTQPIPVSAPPITEPGGLEAASRRLDDYDETERSQQVRSRTLNELKLRQAEQEAVRAAVPAPIIREIMVFSNRVNYNHFYKMPVHVGLQNVPLMVSEMQREGCRLDDIQITFELQEWRA